MTKRCIRVLEICCSNRYTQPLPQWECRFRRCLANEKSPQNAIRWYIGVLLYQCLLSYGVFWNKQAAALPVQDKFQQRLGSLNLQTCIKPGNLIYHLSKLFIHQRNCLLLKIVFTAKMDLRSPKRRETQLLSNVLLAMSQSASQQKAFIGTFTNQRTSQKTVSEKEVNRSREMF